MQGEGCLLLHRSSTGTILLNRPEAGYTLAPFGSANTLQALDDKLITIGVLSGTLQGF